MNFTEVRNIIDYSKIFLIGVKNTIESAVLKQNIELKITKPNKEKHGYGLKSIRETIEKYNGNSVIKEDEKMFVISILITK